MIKFSKRELDILKKTKKFVEAKYANHRPKVGGHGIDHAKRVVGVAAYLSQKEKQPLFLPVLAAFLHDVGRTSDDPRSLNYLHGQLSMEISQQFLTSLGLTEMEKSLVENAIEDHTFLNEKVRESFVAKILMDADRLDSLGAMAPVKAASYRWDLPPFSRNTKPAEDGEIDSIFGYFGIRNISWAEMMWTETGKKMSSERVKFLKKYNKQFVKEITFMDDCFNKLKI